jgi:glyoxylase-like metal-dependent hydrolase (beta-lactamase superfamily II)
VLEYGGPLPLWAAISDMCEAYGAQPWEVVPGHGPEWWLPRWARLRARRAELAQRASPLLVDDE